MATLLTQQYNLNLIPGQNIVVVNAAAYDNSPRLIRFNMFNGAVAADISGWSARVEGTRQGTKAGFSTVCTVASPVVSFAITDAMTASSGKHQAAVVFYQGEERVASATFILNVAPAVLDESTPATEEDATIYQQWLAANTSQIQTNANEISVLKGRMDEFASLPPGSTEGNAELVDIRVGYDGTTYPTAGDAVRNQVTDLKNEISNLVVTPELRNGTVSNGGNANAIATRYVVPVSAALSIVKLIKTVTGAVSYKFGVYTFDATVAGMTSSAANVSGHSIRRNASFYEGELDNFSIVFSENEKYFVFDALAFDADGNAIPLRIANLGLNALSVTYGISASYARGLVDAEKSRTDTIFAEQMDVIKLDANTYDFGFVLGTLNPGSSSAPGTEGNNNKRIRSTYIRCGKGSIVTASAPRTNLLVVYEYDKNKSYISDSAWTDGNRYAVNNDGYIRILMRYSESNDTITDAYKTELEGYLTLNRYIPQSIADENEVNIVDIYSEYVHKYTDYARHQRGSIGTPLTLLHFSDLHSDIGALSRIATDADNLSAQIDGKICTGDMVANTAVQIASWWDTSVMTCIGNHETASYDASTGYNWTALSMADRDAYYIAPFESEWGITHTAGTSYYYKDYSAQKVRLIVMDAMLYSGTPGAEATAQTAWLADLLSDAIASAYHVLIAIHAPHGGATAKVCSFSRYGQGTMPTYADCNTPQSVIDAVSEAITSGLHFIGYLVGHTHQDNIWDAEGDGKQLMYCITCAAVAQATQWSKSDQYRDTGNDAFNIVTIDTTNTLVKIVRGGGADIDDHMRTRKAICFNYSTGEKVGEVL